MALRCDDVADLVPALVLGALEAEEAAAVRAHLASCPEAHAEVVELGLVVPALLESVEVVAPPPSLRARILEAATADGMTGAVEGNPADAAVRGPATWFRRSAWLAAAAAVLVVALGARTLQVQAELAGLEAYRAGVMTVLEVAAQPGSQVAVLAAPEDGGRAAGLAAIGADGRLALVMRELGETTGSEVYEAWLIAEDGAPVPAGSFRVAGDGSATVVLTPLVATSDGVIVALTREPGPGATTPTLPIVALGTARPVAG